MDYTPCQGYGHFEEPVSAWTRRCRSSSDASTPGTFLNVSAED